MSRTRAAYRAGEVELLARNPDEVAVKGIAAGTMVTLVEVKPDGVSDSAPASAHDEGRKEMMRKIVDRAAPWR